MKPVRRLGYHLYRFIRSYAVGATRMAAADKLQMTGIEARFSEKSNFLQYLGNMGVGLHSSLEKWA